MASYDLTINKGETLARTIRWKDSLGVPVNLAGYTARMQVRKTVIDAVVLLDLTTENGGITLGAGEGTIVLNATATATSAVSAMAGVYDLEVISPDGFVTRLLEGNVAFTPEVTR